jgi:type III restriction enzyme
MSEAGAAQGFGISATTLAELRGLLEASPGIQRAWIFGSRARGTQRDVSDIDLAIDAPAWSDADFQALLLRVAQLGTLYKLDVVHWQRVQELVFHQEIERDRRVLWEPRRSPAAAATVGGVVFKRFQEQVLEKLCTYLIELRRQRAATEQQTQALQAMEGAEETLRAVADFPARTWAALRKAGELPPLLKGQSAEHHSRWDGAGRAIPNVCLKVPTGGGKTLLGAAAVGQILQGWQRRSTGLVLWVVPNEAIYSQTLKALANRDHPYRQLLNVAGAGRVRVLEKTHPLTRQDVDGQLCVMLLMLAGANRRNKDTLKFFADSGRVSGFLPREDDLPAHHALLQAVPNLDAYRSLGQTAEEARAQMGSVVKSSLGNVMRLVRPLVIIDEGHHAYSEGALQTLDGFNPAFVLELSATPRLAATKKGVASSGSNLLANVHGTDLDAAEMIKLPIHVDVRGWGDWRTCLTAALQQLDALQRQAEALQGETARYIRPILLVQVERTGAEHRDTGYIHAEDAREHLLALGLQPRQIAVKTSERNELGQPENIDLLSPTCEVRAIITKQALQEGWDCPFAYVLCALAAGRNLAAMTQLVGRVLRLPHVAKTGRAALDACYVLCHDAETGQVVAAIKKSLEDEGMGDLGLTVQGGQPDPDAPRAVAQKRRAAWQGVRLFLPRVTWVAEDGTRRSLEYESDVLAGLNWSGVQPADWVAQWAPDSNVQRSTTLALGLELLDGGGLQWPQAGGQGPAQLDRGRVVRALADLTPSPWLAWSWLAAVEVALRLRGLAPEAVAGSALSLIETLRAAVERERDLLAEAHFGTLLAQGRIEFCLRADQADYELPADFELMVGAAAQAWMAPSGLAPMQRTLYEPALRTADINEFEHRVAGWLDEQQAVRWWHRNVARTQLGLQGWRRHKVYPDFVFAMDAANGTRRVVLLETKGLHLKNEDTAYKQALLSKLSLAFRDDRWAKVGSLQLEGGDADELRCELVFDQDWQGQLNHRLFSE